MLFSWREGDDAALDQLVPLVYPQLRQLARRYLRRENPEHSLQTSALINEAYLRLVDQQDIPWKDRAHFFAVSAQIMRRILIDHARSRNCTKRGTGVAHVPLDDASVVSHERAAELIALDDALKSLAKIDERKSRIVTLRFFGGLSVEETAEVMQVSPITINREWRAAKAWLYREFRQTEDSQHPRGQDEP